LSKFVTFIMLLGFNYSTNIINLFDTRKLFGNYFVIILLWARQLGPIED
jgi:hypothetical protein